MLSSGTDREVFSGWDFVPTGAQTLLGPLADSPFEAVIALLVLLGIGVAFIAGAAQMPVLAGSGRVTSQSNMHLLIGPAPYGYSERTLFFVERRIRGEGQHVRRPGLNSNFIRRDSVSALTKRRSEQMTSLRLREAKSMSSPERGPPLPGKINRLAASDRTSSHARSRTNREVRNRTGKRTQ